MRGLKILSDELYRAVMILTVAGISIIVSYFDPWDLPVDAAWVAILLCGIPIFIEATIGLVKHHDIKAGLLVSIALVAAILTGEIFAAGEIAFIMGLGEALEVMTVRRARAGIEKLVDMTPRTARVVRDGAESVIDASDVNVGDVIRVLAGETIPADGIVADGRTSVDQSILTGESLPVDKDIGDEVFSGTVNQFGTFDMKVTVEESDSSFQRMVRLVQSADAGKAKIVRTADRWATWIVIIALAAAAFAWIVTGDVIRAVTVLVVFCPCALVLATPTAIVAAIGNVTKYGILVKEGDAMERLATVRRIVFDKTGTLTYGKPAVIDVMTFNDSYSKDDVLMMAASAELRSEHPLGRAIVRHARETLERIDEPEGFELIVSRGVSATVNGRNVIAGNFALMDEAGIEHGDAVARTSKFTDTGSTVVSVAVDNEIVGVIVLSDTLRNNIGNTIAAVREMGIECTMLTGDNAAAARNIASKVCVTDMISDCLPEDKVNAVRDYERTGEAVCMIGDGINDAPALKTATVGIAMGGVGSDIAIDAADLAFATDDIQNLPHLIGLSKKTMRTIKLNLAFSMTLNFAAIALAMIGTLDPVTGALVHNAGSIIVIANSSLLLGWRMKRRKTEMCESCRAAQMTNACE